MNQRARDLVVILRGIAAAFQATGISFHIIDAWAFIHIVVASDAAVHTLGADLGLDVPSTRSLRGTWWYRALWQRGDVRFELTGPHHQGAPPSEGGARS